MNEATIIDVIKAAFGALVAPGAYDFQDDAAMIPPVVPMRDGGDRSRVITTDVVVEGVDFDRALYPVVFAGYRALAQNVSDLSAMGAFPTGFVWSLAIPPSWLDDGLGLIAELAKGASILAKLRTVPLFGGDLSRTSGPLVVAITAFGDVNGLPIRRSGARPGDVVWLSRPVGGSAAGLRAIRLRPSDDEIPFEEWLRGLSDVTGACVRAHVMPLPEDPRVIEAASAAIDVSDGLAIDAHRLASASGVRLDLDALDAAIAPGATREDALGGGEDYALLFTAPPGARVDGIRLGVVVEGEGVWSRGARLEATGFDHFGRTGG